MGRQPPRFPESSFTNSRGREPAEISDEIRLQGRFRSDCAIKNKLGQKY